MVGSIRFGGIASGLDTEKIVKELMKAESAPLNNLMRKKQLEEWKRDSYREMNSLLLELQNSANSLRYSGGFNKKMTVSENDLITSTKVVGSPALSSYAVEVKNLAKAEMPASIQFTVDPSITNKDTAIGSAFDFEVNGVTINVLATDTIDNVIQKVNASSSGIEAFYVDNKLQFQSKTGAIPNGATFDVKVLIGDGSKLGMSTTASTSSARTAGTSATVVINGITLTSTSNTLKYDGVEFTLKQTNIGAPINVNVKTDEDAVFDSIKSFVDKYNEVIDKINTKIAEPKYKGYQPLLDEEKQELPESTVDKLESMAKSGLLLRDPILQTGLNSLRFALSNPLTGADSAFDTLSEIGITGPPNGKTAYLENGKLYIDETKLRQAINENGDKVTQLFTQYDSSGDPNKTGLAERVYDELNKTIKQLTDKAGSGGLSFDDSVIGKNIQTIDDQIDTWQDRLNSIEDRYWKQFTAMEQAISKANSQSGWFAQMLGQ